MWWHTRRNQISSFGEKRTSPFKSAGASVQSTTGSGVVRTSGSNAGYTMFRGSVKSTGYPLHSSVSPSLPLPCVTVCHQVSNALYLLPPNLMHIIFYPEHENGCIFPNFVGLYQSYWRHIPKTVSHNRQYRKTSGLMKFIILGLWKRDMSLILRKYECIHNLSWGVWKKKWEV